MSLGNRIALSFVAVLAVLFALAFLGLMCGRWDEDAAGTPFRLASAESKSELCMDPETREHVRAIMFLALDQAIKIKIEELFAVWLRDETGQPGRAVRGLENALRAYTAARASAVRFNPPECSG